MKRLLKVLAVLIGLLLLAGGAFAAYIHFSKPKKYEVRVPEFTLRSDSAAIAEGKRHAVMVCNQCHMGENGLLEGNQLHDMPAMFGKAWSANITRDSTYGIGKYTAGELAYLLRTGIKRDGEYAPPWMPKFPLLSDDDLNNIIAYITSDAPELAPSKKQHPLPQPSFFAKFLLTTVFRPYEYPSAPIATPDSTDKVALGRYLATVKVECFQCHSISFDKANILEPEKTPGFMAGGNPTLGKDGSIVYSRNITMDKETGIGTWTEEQFINAVKYGQREGKPSLRYPMVPHTAFSDEEVSAIWAYLQTIPTIHHDIDALASK